VPKGRGLGGQGRLRGSRALLVNLRISRRAGNRARSSGSALRFFFFSGGRRVFPELGRAGKPSGKPTVCGRGRAREEQGKLRGAVSDFGGGGGNSALSFFLWQKEGRGGGGADNENSGLP